MAARQVEEEFEDATEEEIMDTLQERWRAVSAATKNELKQVLICPYPCLLTHPCDMRHQGCTANMARGSRADGGRSAHPHGSSTRTRRRAGHVQRGCIERKQQRGDGQHGRVRIIGVVGS